MQWYSSPKAAIMAGSYKLRPSNTTGVRSATRMASKSGVRNFFHSVTMANASAPCSAAAAEPTIDRPGTSPARSRGLKRRHPLLERVSPTLSEYSTGMH